MNGNANKVVFIITAGLVLVLFISAFVLSYEALRDLAENNGIKQKLAWMWPLGLDAFMAVASLYLLWAHLNKTWEPLPLALVMVAMGASVVFNIVHAPPTNLARSVAALPPLVAFMAFEVFIIMVRHNTERATVKDDLDQLIVQRDQLTGQIDQEQATLDRLRERQKSIKERTKALEGQASELRQTVKELSVDPVTARRERLRSILAENGREWTHQELADELGVSLSTVKRDLREIEPQ